MNELKDEYVAIEHIFLVLTTRKYPIGSILVEVVFKKKPSE
ncbi:MAG: hypothetical protein QM536_02650 [Chitinophagaceae bacterium]|nr:hypothetical protein [Chitinophagaceae bacterium]